MPWSDGRKYAATVVWAGENSARVAFEDGALKTVPLEELEPLSTRTATSQHVDVPKSSRTGTDRLTDKAALETKLREDNWTITEKQYQSKDGTDKYYHKPGESKQYRSLLEIARAHYPEFLTGKGRKRASTDTPSPAQTAPVAPPPPPPPPLPTDPCAICMSTITEDACVLACGHAYHARCLGDLADHVRLAAPTRRSLGVSCPLCRKVTRAEVGAEED